ncbi:ubiquitin C-terminal hydrolase [Coccidioides posadasii str. Silveira]|uniref:Ubiquitin C-terminal hydrolase n=1 Tax=Coccidioides posadasii (strain RMSCC 757 / Silveira) TaxID=443226 RepID=E9CRE7_COCPS|nr:ubiquitin C-terminal hydrolase [Coccidioides posadasii str. Silveira]
MSCLPRLLLLAFAIIIGNSAPPGELPVCQLWWKTWSQKDLPQGLLSGPAAPNPLLGTQFFLRNGMLSLRNARGCFCALTALPFALMARR